MNKKNLSLILLAISAMTACTHGKADSSASEADSVSQAETAIQSDADMPADTTQQEPQEVEMLTTADLQFFELQGPVKQMSYVGTDMTICYDRDGNITTIGGEAVRTKDRMVKDPEDSYYKRDKKGLITQYCAWEWGSYYTWKGGRIVSELAYNEGMNTENTYHYDAEGHLVGMSCVETEEGEEGENRYEIKYVNKNFDSYGNWTLRDYKNASNSGIIQRNIEYYE